MDTEMMDSEMSELDRFQVYLCGRAYTITDVSGHAQCWRIYGHDPASRSLRTSACAVGGFIDKNTGKGLAWGQRDQGVDALMRAISAYTLVGGFDMPLEEYVNATMQAPS
jgi:predicted aminopeptidase